MSELQAFTALCTCIIACVFAACFAIHRRFELYSWPIILSPSQSSDTCKQTLECVGCQVLCMHTIIVQMLAINLSCVNCKTHVQHAVLLWVYDDLKLPASKKEIQNL